MVAGVAVMIRFLLLLALLGAGGTFYLKKTRGIGPSDWIVSQVAQIFGRKTGVDALVTGGRSGESLRSYTLPNPVWFPCYRPRS